MVVKVVVLYPNEGGSDPTKFNMDYYLSTHMPLVSKHWTSYGLKSWEVVQFGPGPDGAQPKYAVQATLTWGAVEEVGKAMAGPEAKEVLGDIPNFCNKQPVLIGGEVLKTG